ncbi:MAG TPA: CPBP family glutamic-type intramembrane protease [Anaerolineales bacterium]
MTTGIAIPQAEKAAAPAGWIARHPLLTMYLIMFGVEFTNATLYILYARGVISFKTPDSVMFIMSILHPAVAAAVVTVAISGRKGLRELFSRFLILRVSGWWYVFILAFYAIDMLAGNSLNAAFGGAKPVIPVAGDPLWQIPIKFAVFLLFGVVTNTEEIAWRGVALPLLKARYNNALMAALLVALPEALLHAPDYFVSEMNFRKSVGALMFTIFTIALSVIFAWVFLNTKGSLLIVTLFHASGNAWSNLLTDDSIQPFYYSIAIIVIFAIAVVLIYGPKTLTRQANE